MVLLGGGAIVQHAPKTDPRGVDNALHPAHGGPLGGDLPSKAACLGSREVVHRDEGVIGRRQEVDVGRPHHDRHRACEGGPALGWAGVGSAEDVPRWTGPGHAVATLTAWHEARRTMSKAAMDEVKPGERGGPAAAGALPRGKDTGGLR